MLCVVRHAALPLPRAPFDKASADVSQGFSVKNSLQICRDFDFGAGRHAHGRARGIDGL